MTDSASIERPKPLSPDEQFAANLAIMEQVNPELAKGIKLTPLANLNLGCNPDGYVIGGAWDLDEQTWVPLCSQADPWGEAETDANAMWTPDAKIFTLFGFGLGYLAAAIARRLLPYQRLSIYESRPQHYAAAARSVNLADTLGREGRRVDTFLGENLDAALQNWWLTFESSEKFFIASPVMCGFTQQIDRKVYLGLMNRAMEMHRYHMVGLATWQQFGGLIGDNDLENLPEFCSFPGLNELKDIWKGKPAVCVAAGPSLLSNLHVLTDPALRSKVAVLTVGTTYALVRALGIEPDVVTTIDFQELNWGDQFKGIPLDGAPPLVYLHSTWPETPRRWPGPRYVAMNASDTVGWLMKYAEPKPHAAQVQTVAHLNLAVAYTMGADPIILIGQDLSMPADKHHAPGARVQDTTPDGNPDDHIPMTDFEGKPCFSRHSFLSMKTVFEQLMAMCKGVTFWNCTEGGLALVGAENRPLGPSLAGLPEADAQLRPTLHRRFREYVPGTRWSDLEADLGQLAGQTTVIHDTAQSILNWNKELQDEDGVTDYAKELRGKILSQDQVFGKFPVAFSQFAVRSFKIVEVLAGIPPKPGSSEEDIIAFNIKRLVGISEEMVKASHVILSLVHRAEERLRDVMWARNTESVSLEKIKDLIQRQSFHAIELCLSKMNPAYRYRAMAQLYRNQQCYHRAADLYESLDMKPDVVTRCRKMLQQHNGDMQHLRRMYYSGGVDLVVTATSEVAFVPQASGNGQADPEEETAAVGRQTQEIREELTHGNSPELED